MAQILLNDILKIADADIKDTKIKLNVFNGQSDPLEEYKKNPDEINTNWLLWHRQNRYFHTGNIAMCLLYLGNDRWLLTTIKRITKELDVVGGVGYQADEIKEYKKYFGRIVIKYHNTNRTIGRTYASLMDSLEVAEILSDIYSGDDFPGYENIRLTYTQLSTILTKKKPGWIAALQNQKAVYLITDRKTGKLYVGSATSQNGMLLQRWETYIANGHGGNKKLQELINNQGFQYIKDNFQYSVLENYNARMDDNYILKREIWWKETLCSRTHGYNGN